MTFTQSGRQRILNPTQPPPIPRQELPTMYDLPSEFSEELGLPDSYHDLQPNLLSDTLRLPEYPNGEFFTGSDFNIYYDLEHRLWHKRPDWFLVVGVPFLHKSGDLRLSYVTWQEPANPFIVVELISPGTEDEDFGRTTDEPDSPPTKWTVYEQILQVPYYVIFNRYIDELRVFKLQVGQYQELSLPENRLWIPELKIGLGLWQGIYQQGTHQETERLWLRWYGEDGQWLPTTAEVERQRANAEQQRANAEQQRANAERQRADAERQRALSAEAELAALKAKLKRQGVDLEDIQ